MDLTGFYGDSLGFMESIGFDSIQLGSHHYSEPVLLGFTGLHWVLMGFTEFYWVFTGLYWVLLGFTGFYWVLRSFTGFLLVFFLIYLLV